MQGGQAACTLSPTENKGWSSPVLGCMANDLPLSCLLSCVLLGDRRPVSKTKVLDLPHLSPVACLCGPSLVPRVYALGCWWLGLHSCSQAGSRNSVLWLACRWESRYPDTLHSHAAPPGGPGVAAVARCWVHIHHQRCCHTSAPGANGRRASIRHCIQIDEFGPRETSSSSGLACYCWAGLVLINLQLKVQAGCAQLAVARVPLAAPVNK